jgi:hypothetical protein
VRVASATGGVRALRVSTFRTKIHQSRGRVTGQGRCGEWGSSDSECLKRHGFTRKHGVDDPVQTTAPVRAGGCRLTWTSKPSLGSDPRPDRSPIPPARGTTDTRLPRLLRGLVGSDPRPAPYLIPCTPSGTSSEYSWPRGGVGPVLALRPAEHWGLFGLDVSSRPRHAGHPRGRQLSLGAAAGRSATFLKMGVGRGAIRVGEA